MFRSNYQMLLSDHAKLQASHDKLRSDFEQLQEQISRPSVADLNLVMIN